MDNPRYIFPQSSVYPQQEYSNLQTQHSRCHAPTHDYKQHYESLKMPVQLPPISTVTKSEFSHDHVLVENPPLFAPYSNSRINPSLHFYPLPLGNVYGNYFVADFSYSVPFQSEFSVPLHFHEQNTPSSIQQNSKQDILQSNSSFSQRIGQKIEQLSEENHRTEKSLQKHAERTMLLHPKSNLCGTPSFRASSSSRQRSPSASIKTFKFVPPTARNSKKKYDLKYRVKIYCQHGAKKKKYQDLKFETKVFRSNYRGRF